jgi:hypothetical protein
LLLLGFLAGVAVAVIVPVLSRGSGPEAKSVSAAIIPVGCDTSVGSAGASIRIPAVPPNPQDNDVLAYKVGVTYTSSSLACDAYDVDVFFQRPPGLAATPWVLACNFAVVHSGDALECTPLQNYTVSGADRDGAGDLIAHVHMMGNKHGGVNDCVVAGPRDPTTTSKCFDASVGSAVNEANTPTPTATNTPANTATLTPAATNTPTATATTRTVLKTHTPVPATAAATVVPTVNTVLSLSGTPTVNVVLELAATPRDPIVAVLPATGGGATGADGTGRSVIAVLSIAAGLALALGVETRRRQRRATK